MYIPSYDTCLWHVARAICRRRINITVVLLVELVLVLVVLVVVVSVLVLVVLVLVVLVLVVLVLGAEVESETPKLICARGT